jgi:hypothetical protein
MEANEQVTFPPLPCDRYPAAGHPLRDLPPHRGVLARLPLSEVLTEHYRQVSIRKSCGRAAGIILAIQQRDAGVWVVIARPPCDVAVAAEVS